MEVDVAIDILPAQEGILVLRHAHAAEPDRWIRAEATRALARIGVESHEVIEHIRRQLLREQRFFYADRIVSGLAAVAALPRAAEQLLPQVLEWLWESDQQIAAAVSVALTGVGAPAVEALMDVIHSDRFNQRGSRAHVELVRLARAEPAAQTSLHGLIETGGTKTRQYLLFGFASIVAPGPPPSWMTEALGLLARDYDYGVASQARRLLLQRSPPSATSG